ncbi:zf-HC2 domain-containing protein [bacterium]|nr:zf-HC2 domain-containing protein [bacterium]
MNHMIVRTKVKAPDCCSNDYIRAMLVPYAERTLSRANRAEVDEHLQECPYCKEDVKRILGVLYPLAEISKEKSKPVFEDHPSHSDLYLYIINPEQLSEDNRRDVYLHSLLCAACREELGFIKQIDKDFLNLPPADSVAWTLPKELNKAIYPPVASHVSDLEETSVEETEGEVYWLDRLLALLQKINLRLGIIVGVSLLIVFCGLYFVMCNSDNSDEVEKGELPVNSPLNYTADDKDWSKLKLDNINLEKAKTTLDRAKIISRVSGNTLVVKHADYNKASRIIEKLVATERTRAKEIVVVKDEADKLPSGTENNEVAHSEVEELETETVAKTEEQVEVFSAEKSNGYQSEPETKKVEEENSILKPVYRAKPVKARPKAKAVAVNAKSNVSPAPKVEARKTDHITSSVKEQTTKEKREESIVVETPAVESVVTSNNPEGVPVPVSVPTVVTDSSVASKVQPEPEVIHLNEDVNVQSERKPVINADEHVEINTAPTKAPQEFTTGGNKYDSSDNIINKEIIE